MSVSRSHTSRLAWLIVGLAALGIGAILFWFDPAAFGFYPVCLFYRTTGLLCPGCGGLRAAHQLLHGHWAAAFHLNALVTIGLPCAILAAVWLLLRRVRHGPRTLEIRPLWLWLGLLALVAFGVGRNLARFAGPTSSPPQSSAPAHLCPEEAVAGRPGPA